MGGCWPWPPQTGACPCWRASCSPAADARLQAWHRGNEASRRLATVPGIGPVTACLLAIKVVDPGAFKSGRGFAAWPGLTPKDHLTAGKARPGGITRDGDEALRSLLVVGATSVIRHLRPPAPPRPGQAQGQAGTGQAGAAGAASFRPDLWSSGRRVPGPGRVPSWRLAWRASRVKTCPFSAPARRRGTYIGP